MSILTASQTVSFTGGGGGARIVMQLEPGIFRRDYAVRIWPSDPDRVVASVGRITINGVRNLDIRYEPIVFNGTDAAEPRYPMSGLIRYEPVGDIFAPDLSVASGVRLHWDPAAGKLRASRPIIGSYVVDYVAQYLRVLYAPTQLARTSYELGTVFAYRQGTVASLAIDLRAAESEDYAELYSVISYGVVQGDSPGRISDVWELPPGWPEDASYPGLATEGPDPDASVTIQRVHERAFINRNGAIIKRPITVAREQPYAGVLGYRPAYELSRGSAPGEDWNDAFGDAPWEDILPDLAARYPGLDLGDG